MKSYRAKIKKNILYKHSSRNDLLLSYGQYEFSPEGRNNTIKKKPPGAQIMVKLLVPHVV